MGSVKFSVVIPTRERATTLRHALLTCLDQDFDDYEVIVSDNQSSPATRAVVDEIASPKVRYVRTPELLAMSSNWDFGVSQARGDYVLLIGDDDGLLGHTLAVLDRLTREHPGRVVRWDTVYYTWPSFGLPEQADYLRVPLNRGLRELDGMQTIEAVIRFCSFYTALPMFYNALVPRSVIERLKARTGRVFPHPVPDVYSGFAVAAVAGTFLSCELPLSISGQSGASNGIAVLFNRGRSRIDAEFRNLNAREGLSSDRRIPDLPAFPHVPVADSFLSAKRMLFPDSPIELDRRQFVTGCIENLCVDSPEDWQLALRQLRESLADDADTRAWFDSTYARTPFRRLPPPRFRPDRLGYDGEALHLNAARFGVTDVSGVARLCEQLLNYRQDGVQFARSLVQELRLILDERAKVIAGLKRECDLRLEKILELDARLRAATRGGPVKRMTRWLKHRLLRKTAA
jgi:hypothetical protein